jgi:hypothetical protein
MDKSQMACLPEQADGSRSAFELINENPLPRLDRIMELAGECSFALPQMKWQYTHLV